MSSSISVRKISHITSIAAAMAVSACNLAYGAGAGAGAGAVAPSTNSGRVSPGGPSASGDSAPAGTPSVAPNARFSDFAFAVHEAQGNYYSAFIIDKMTTFKVGGACMAKMTQKNSVAIQKSSYYVLSILKLVKLWTGDDWEAIETQANNDREKGRVLVEPLADKFASQFHMTITVEGDDCDMAMTSRWLNYWYQVSETFGNHPPAAKKLAIDLKMTNTRETTASVDATGTTFAIVGPIAIVQPHWEEIVNRPFLRVTSHP